MTETENTDMKAFWNGNTGLGWVRFQDQLDVMLKPFSNAAMERAMPMDGADILDIGCGCGDTSLELGRRAGPSGHVTGIDISQPMLARAQKRGTEALADNVSFRHLDAQTGQLGEQTRDIVFSRFGVMFFDEPVRAFSNMKSALKPGGQMVFICWQPPKQNQWVQVAVDVVRRHVELPPPPAPEDPGEFAFGDADRVRRIMAGAGFSDISIDAFESPISLAGGVNLDDTVDFTMMMGPASRAIASAGDDTELRGKLSEEMRDTLAPYETENGVIMGSACWLVSAQNASP